MHRTSRLLGAAAIALASVTSVGAAAPWVILVTGAQLERPVILANMDENLQFMLAVTQPFSPPTRLAGRPFYEVAMFWGPEWQKYIADGSTLTALKPEQANQHGRFYPAAGNEPAVFEFVDQPGRLNAGGRPSGPVRSVGRGGLEVFATHGLVTGGRSPTWSSISRSSTGTSRGSS